MTKEEKKIYENLRTATEDAERFLRSGNRSPIIQAVLTAIRNTGLGREVQRILMNEVREMVQKRRTSKSEIKEAVQDVQEGERPDYSELNIRELKKVAKKLNLKGVSNLSKSELIAKLEEERNKINDASI